jgi:hypothetical protein
MSTGPDRTRLASHITRTRFLHIEDSLERGKLRFFIGSYERGKGSGPMAFAFLDIDDARVILNDLAWGKPVDFVDYKGTKGVDGSITSRVLKIRFIDGKCWVDIQAGPGETVGPGAVKPKGKPSVDISIPLTIVEARRIAFTCLAYLQAWDVVRMLKRENLVLDRSNLAEQESRMQ